MLNVYLDILASEKMERLAIYWSLRGSFPEVHSTALTFRYVHLKIKSLKKMGYFVQMFQYRKGNNYY